jgi:cytochrome d ubiquinol oxidase subunit II
LKTEGDLQKRIRGWVNRTILCFIVCYALTTLATLIFAPHMLVRFREYPLLFGLPLLNVLAIANIPREIHHGREIRAFLSSCLAVVALLAIFGLGMYPNMILSNPPENSLTIYEAASSQKTLGIMLVVAISGMPLVIAYTVSIYWIFRGKVVLDELSY